MIVIDASLGVKWFFEETYSEQALRLFTQNMGQISVPDIFGIEVMSALVREANVQKSKATGMLMEVTRFEQLLANGSLEKVSTSPLQLAQAANIAIDLGHPLKDCIYLALAMQLNCSLITCDAKFASRAKDIWPQVQTLEELKS